MRLGSRLREPADIAIVALFVGAELGVLIAPPDGSRAALHLFPALWTLPLLLRRRWPIASSLAVIGALAIEAQIAYAGTESLWALPPAIMAFFTIGRRVDLSRAIVAWALGIILGGILVSSDSGPVSAAAIGFLVIVAGPAFVAGVALRARAEEALEMKRRAARLEGENEARAQAAVAEERARIARELHDMIG